MLGRHSAVYIIAKILPGLLGMGTTAALTHLLDPRQYGLFGLALVVMAFGNNLIFDWLGLAFMRFYQGGPDDRRVLSTFGWLFSGLIVLSLVMAGLGAMTGMVPEDSFGVVGVGALMMLASSWFELTARIQIARLHPGRYLRMNIGRALFVLAGATGAAWLTRDPVLTGLGMAAGLVAGVALAGGEQPFPRLNLFDRVTARSIIIFGLPMAVSMAMSGLTNSGTRALVEGLDSTAALGVFTAAYMIVQNTLAAIAAGVASAAYPLAVRAVDGGDPVVARRQLLANGEMLLTIVAPIAVGMALTADGIAEILVGPHFQSGLAELTPWMAAGTFFAVIRANYLDHAFQLGKRPHLQIRVTAFAAVWAIGLCVWLVPHQGPTGAAIAITVAMAFSCVHAWFAGKRAYPLPFPSVAFAKVGTACAVMAAMVLAVPGHGTGVFVTKVGLGGAGYAAIAVATDLLGLRRTLLDRWARGPNAERIRDALTSRGRAR